MMSNENILIIGYGNPGRQDDGLGPAFVQQIGEWSLSHVASRANYQLTVEDAYDVAEMDVVVFVDAAISGEEPFSFDPVPSVSTSFLDSHSLSPEAVMELSRSLFKATTEAFVLGIRGYEFDRFEEQLSSRAEQNLRVALQFMEQWLRERSLEHRSCA